VLTALCAVLTATVAVASALLKRLTYLTSSNFSTVTAATTVATSSSSSSSSAAGTSFSLGFLLLLFALSLLRKV